MNLKNIVLKYQKDEDSNVTRRLLNTIFKHEGSQKDLVQEDTLVFLNELTTSINEVILKHGLKEKDAANVLHVVAHSALNDNFE